MVVTFKKRKLEKSVSTFNDIKANYGTMAKNVNTRFTELRAAPSLQDMAFLPQANCHELSGDRNGELAVDISGNFRIIFEPNHSPLPLTKDGGLDWSQVTAIKVLEIGVDYH